jgi:hypothetical protein
MYRENDQIKAEQGELIFVLKKIQRDGHTMADLKTAWSDWTEAEVLGGAIQVGGSSIEVLGGETREEKIELTRRWIKQLLDYLEIDPMEFFEEEEESNTVA